MKILLTGARGQLAADLHAVLAPSHAIFALSREELDIGDTPALEASLDRVHPDVVINCAAFHRVDEFTANE